MLAVKLKVAPIQSGLLLVAVGAAGIEFTVTDVVPFGPVHPFSVADTEYVPAFAEVIAAMTGF